MARTPLIIAACCLYILFLAPFIACSSPCKADEKEKWSYRGNNAAKHWGKINPACNGKQQSPIALSRRTAIPKPDLPKIAMNNYDKPVTKALIENNGHTVQVTPKDDVVRTISVKGSTYTLLQLHFHWGDASNHGAEHTLDGKKYAMEVHFVHKNDKNQLAVVGVFFEEKKDSSTPELKYITEAFSQVMYKGMKANIMSTNLNLNKLLPANPSSFYRYAGSLTTPGCAEGVTWSVLVKPIPVGKEQMKAFRSLYSAKKDDASSACKLSNNYRPVQPLHGRKVYRSQ